MAVPGAFLAPFLLLLCGLGPYLAAARSPPGVECVLFNEEYMTCTWGSRETLTANYSLYYWYENRSPMVECKHYLQDQGISIGCRFNQSEIIQFQPFHVLVNASLGGRTLEIPSERMELQDLVKPEAPVNLTIRNMSSNQLQLTWTSPYPKAQCLEHAVKYKSNKDTSWTEHRVKGDIFSFPSVDYEKYYTFYVRSKINSYCGSTQLWSEWSVPVVWGSNSTSKGVECVLFNEEYMTCTWGSRETLTANYSLYYWYENRSPMVECKHYLQDQGISIGCRFNQSEIIQFQPFHVLVNASLGGRTLEIPSERMELQDLVKPEAPVNLTIRNMSSNQLQLTWTSPYPKAQCLEHAVKYKSNKDTSWTEHRVKGDIFSFPSVDYEKYYTFYVRSKINSYCGSTQLWSEWSVPVVWGSNSTSKGMAEEQLHWFWIHTILIPIASCMILLVLVILLVRMERVWVILMPRIPNPSKNFDELFITHNGNFQEWAGVPKDVMESFKPNYSESICYVSELPPKDSYEPLWQSSNHAPSMMPGAPAAPCEHSPYKNSYVGV